MLKKRKNSGFSMAEMLIVVAIIAVLGGVSFIGVTNYQRSMSHLELDAVAKEIFVAAQNHLVMAKSQNYLGVTDYGYEETGDDSASTGIYYIVKGDATEAAMLDMMLPVGSIDDTVRAGGSYIIRYQPSTALVLDVFYCEKSGRYAHTLTGADDYTKAMTLSGDGNRSARRNVADWNGAVLGWYGGSEAEQLEQTDIVVHQPTIEVINAERLLVKITDPNNLGTEKNASLKLVIRGVTSKATKTITIRELTSTTAGDTVTKSLSIPSDPRVKDISATSVDTEDLAPKPATYLITLDDITPVTISGTTYDQRFCKLGSDNSNPFIPGEDIIIQGMADNNIEKVYLEPPKPSVTTNSLFARVDTSAETGTQGISGEPSSTAQIGNIRHLENLDANISGLSATINKAEQITDLDWNEFKQAIVDNQIGDATMTVDTVKIYRDAAGNPTVDGTFAPVTPPAGIDYDGKNHTISNVTVSSTADSAGLFGTVSGKNEAQTDYATAIANLTLKDFNISGLKDVGALAGTLKNVNVTNVLAINSTNAATMKISGTASGSVGGLVGSLNVGSINKCAATLYVSNEAGDVGGLVGTITNADVSNSYSGGHTYLGAYSTSATSSTDNPAPINVVGTNAGGLIGSASDVVEISCSYSTCSVSGSAVSGGFIGEVTGNDVTIEKSYAAGLVVKGTASSAVADVFLGNGTIVTNTNNHFVEGINGEATNALAIPAFREEPEKDSDKVTGEIYLPKEIGGRSAAVPYDTTLIVKYLGKYIYPTVNQLMGNTLATATNPGHLFRHYGDWQGADGGMLTNLEIVNAERLTARVVIPADEFGTSATASKNLAFLIRGETSGQEAYVVVKLNKTTDNDTASYVATSAPGTIIPTFVATGGAVSRMDATATAAWFNKVVSVAPETMTDANTSATTNNVVLTLTLDDITQPGMHFADLFPAFLPGEDIVVVCDGGTSTQTVLSTLAQNETTTKNSEAVPNWTVEYTVSGSEPASRTVAARTNSLFADPAVTTGDNRRDGSNVGGGIAAIANFRHLENLDGAISAVNNKTLPVASGDPLKVTITAAKQIEDLSDTEAVAATETSAAIPAKSLSWTEFVGAVKTGQADKNAKVSIYKYNASDTVATEDHYAPVNPAYALAYDGQGHTITGVLVNATGNAGLFGALGSAINECSVSNLKLIDFNIAATGTGNSAGALAGTLANTTVENVLAVNSTNATETNISSASGNAGGLVGSMVSDEDDNTKKYSTISKSAAALIVSGGTTAGGLVGSADGGDITASYSGGHTEKGEYYAHDRSGTRTNPIYNVTSTTGNAGGLVGSAAGTRIASSYSTCSVNGVRNVGGFVGKIDGADASVSNCYSTGLVHGENSVATVGAFAGDFTGTATNCWYYGIVNDLPGLGSGDNAHIKSFDDSLADYTAFVGPYTTKPSGSPWVSATKTMTDLASSTDYAYDSVLRQYYNEKYPLRTVAQLNLPTGTTVVSGDFVITHYGDWPAPETFVFN